MRELHLFAGIGGGILGGMLLGHRCVGAVEIDPYCRSVLRARQADGVLPEFPILEDVRAFDGKPWRGHVDVVCGGFPCQPWSTAGKRLGTADPRHLWPEMARIVSEVRPAYVFAENVSLAAFEQPWRDLRGMGYRVPPAVCIGASHVGAPHRRLRWWVLAADADRQSLRNAPSGNVEPSIAERSLARLHGQDGHVADAASIGRGTWRTEPAREQGGPCTASSSRAVADTHRPRLAQRQGESGNAGWWATEPRVGRVAHGVPSRVDRLKALGNAQVPAVAAEAFRRLYRSLAP